MRADRDFQTKLARLVRDSLDDNLRCWIEWGNEYWNCGEWGYEGCVFLEELSSKNGLSKRQNYARESLDLFEDFHRVFSETGERNRLLTILGGQSGYAEELKRSAREINKLGRMDEVDVFAIAPYYHKGRKINTAWKQGGIDAVFPILNQIVEDMYNGKGESGEALAGNFELAAKYDKPMVAYEGGQHLTSWMGLEEGLTAIINRAPQMYDHYLNYFSAWEQEEVAHTFVHYSDIAFYNDYEAFGLKEYYDQPLKDNHKLRAFLDWIKGSSAE